MEDNEELEGFPLSEENLTELEQKELEKLNLYQNDPEELSDNNNTKINSKKNTNNTISIFKSTDFNDFPEFSKNEKSTSNNNKKKNTKFIKEKKIEEEKDSYNYNDLYDLGEEQEQDNNNNLNDNDEENAEDDLDKEINLEEQLKKEYEGKSFIDDKIKDDLSDTELLSMTKENIIQYKNYQILKLKTIIKTLRKEKETLLENYKKTTDNFLKHIKELEYRGRGERPMTAKIISNIMSSGDDISKSPEDGERCPNCGEIIKKNFMEHSLECIRKKYKCISCNKLMDIDEKGKHFSAFNNKEKLFNAIKKNDSEYILNALKHNFPVNDTVLDEKTGDYFIHLAIKYNYNLFKVIDKCEINLNLNLENKQKETPLFLAINKKDINLINELLYRGVDINKRNKGDLSPLMLCCKKNYQDIVELLIKKGANVNEKNILGDTPIKIAQINGNEELALKLMKIYKAEIN